MTRILIVDDNAANRDVIRETLAGDSYHIDEATDGNEAIAMIRDRPPDLVLLDIAMPHVNGIDTLRAIKKEGRTARIPIVMVTASSADENVATCFDEGARDYIVPPFSEIVFRARIRAALRNPGTEGPVGLPMDGTTAKSYVRRGKVLGVVGAKGGVGATSVAINFVVQLLGRDRHSVGLIEIHGVTGSLARQMNVSPTVSMSVLQCGKPSGLSVEAFQRACVRHPSGCKILFAPHNIDTAKEMRPTFVKAVVNTARRVFDYAVLDLASTPSAGIRKAISLCDQLVVVTETDAASLTATKRWISRLASWRIPRSSVSLVIVNKTSEEPALSRDGLSREMGFPVIGNIKPDPDGVRLASHLLSLSSRKM